MYILYAMYLCIQVCTRAAHLAKGAGFVHEALVSDILKRIGAVLRSVV